MRKFLIFITIGIFFYHCKVEKGVVSIKVTPDKPVQGEKIYIELSKTFTGTLWFVELSGGDPYRVIPNSVYLKNSKTAEYTPFDKNTSLIFLFLEDSEGKLIYDTSYYVFFYTDEGKVAPFANVLYGFFNYYLKDNKDKFYYYFEKERELYPSHYDFWDNYLSLKLKENKVEKNKIKEIIEDLVEKEKDNPSFIHAAYLISEWVLEDTVLQNKLIEYALKLPDNKYKHSIFITHLMKKKGLEGVLSYIKEKKLDPYIVDFRWLIIKKFGYPVPDFEGLFDYIEFLENENFVFSRELIEGLKLAIKTERKDETKNLALKLERLVDDSYLIKKEAIFYGISNLSRYKSIYENIIKEIYMSLSHYYEYEGDYKKAFSYIERIVKDKDFSSIESDVLKKYANVSKKSDHMEEAKKAYAYLYFYYGVNSALDSLKKIIKGNFEEELKKLEKLVKLPSVSPFEVVLLNGDKFDYNDHKGKIIVLNFWATWCGPCRMEIPELNSLVDEFKDNDKVVFLAITDEDKETVKDFIKEEYFKYILGVEGREIRRNFGVYAFPTHFIIDQKGKIVFKHVGYVKGIKEILKNKINSLLGVS